MRVFLIILAVLAVLIILLMSLSATFTIIYDKGWTTKVKVLFIEKEINLSQILSFILFPEKKAENTADKHKEKKKKKVKPEAAVPQKPNNQEDVELNKAEPNTAQQTENKQSKDSDASAPPQPSKPQKSNPIKKIWDDEGIVGILTLVSNLLQTANSLILTLIRGLHIYSLYVMIIVGGGDAAQIAQAYGRLCSQYYPVKGLIINGMKVDNYDDYIQPDFIAPHNEYEFQIIASISVGLLVKSVLKAGIVFVKNLIKNKKETKKV